MASKPSDINAVNVRTDFSGSPGPEHLIAALQAQGLATRAPNYVAAWIRPLSAVTCSGHSLCTSISIDAARGIEDFAWP